MSCAFGQFAELRSSFTGSDENPLSEGATWSKVNSSDPEDLRRVSNQCTNNGTTTGSRYWNVRQFTDVDAYISIATKVTVDGDNQSVTARLQGVGGAGTWDGYQCSLFRQAATDTWALTRITNNAGASTIASGTQEYAAGDRLGIRCFGTTIQAWYYTGGTWTLLGGGTDTTYAIGYCGLRMRGTTGALDDFYIGIIPPPPMGFIL